MAKAEDKSQEIGTRAPNAVTRPAARAADNQDNKAAKPVVGMPEGYKPDTSVQFVAGKTDKDGKKTPDQIKNEDGTVSDVSPHNAATSVLQLENLPVGHTYRDRVEAQAKALGIEVDPEWTLEYLLWVIRMKGSS